MKLIVSEKNIAARRIAEILALGKPKTEKVDGTPAYRFKRGGEDWVSIGLKGHILGVGFPERLEFDGKTWSAVWDGGGVTRAALPADLSTPPWPKPVKKPFSAHGLELTTWRLLSLPYLVWSPVGKVPTETAIISALQSLAKKADEVVIATDYDREGELIGSDARDMVRAVNKQVPVWRARFSAITQGEIERAFDELGEVSDPLAQAGEARQDIDLLWGAVLTRYLTKARFAGVGQPRSAGRVQTPTLKLIVDRERERRAFVPETYWTVKGTFSADGEEFVAPHAEERFRTEADAAAVMEAVAGTGSGTVVEVTRARRTVKAPTPFNTTALQAAASAEGIAPSRLMRIAETLYMNGLISYPRVDNTVYPESLDLRAILRVLSGVPQFGQHARALLGKEGLTATRGEKEATDHPPIHPTGAGDPDKLKPEEWKVYNLVARRFMATLSDPAVIEATRIGIDVAGQRFVARGDVLVTPGYRAVYPFGLKKDEQLPQMSEGDRPAFLGADMEEKQTQPPARYSQGRLIQEMEKRGLGTKATRHDIIQTLYDRRYVVGDPAEPTSMGTAVIEALTDFAERITTPDMTSELEREMDDIANDRARREEVVEHSRRLLAEVMERLLPEAAHVGEVLKAAAVEDSRVGPCPKCGGDLLVRRSKTGQFVGCTEWPECDVTYPLPTTAKIESVEEAERTCPECGTLRVKVIQFKQRPRILCLSTACVSRHEPEVYIGPCPKCGGRVTARRSQSTLKRFARCENYETCQVSYPLPQTGEIEPTGHACEVCGAPRVVVQTRRGPWHICVDPDCPSKKRDGEKKAAPRKAKRGR